MKKDGKTAIILIIMLAISQLLIPTIIDAEEGGTGKMQSSDVNFLALSVDEVQGWPMVGLRQLGEEYGWKFGYRAEEKTVEIYSSGKMIEVEVGNSSYDNNKMETAPVIKEGRTYLGLDWINVLLQDLEEIKIQLLTSLRTDRCRARPGDEITAIIEVYNIGDETIRLHYPSGQLYDLYLSQKGEELWRWSDDKFFTMALQYKDLEDGDRLYYREKVKLVEGLSAGSYTLSGEIETRNSLPLPDVEIDIFD